MAVCTTFVAGRNIPIGAGMAQDVVNAQDGLRRQNLGRILSLVHRFGSVSRSELVASTGLNRSTVGTLVSELADRGLVEEVRPPPDGNRGPGRPSPLVQPHRGGIVVLACHIAVDTLTCAAIGLGGRLYAVRTMERPRGRLSPDDTLDDLAEVLSDVRSQVGDVRLTAVGVGVVAMVADDGGAVSTAPNLGWDRLPLVDRVRERCGLDVPVAIHNEANLGALAEHARGAGAGVDDFVYLSAEIGVGAGIFVEGRLLRGADGYAGEPGHMPVNPTGRRCACGATGCWETEVGERALLRAAGMDTDGGVEAVATLFDGVATGECGPCDAVAAVGGWLGTGLVTLSHILNPRRVILGGLYARAFPLFADAAAQRIAELSRIPPGALVELRPAALGEHVVLYGAAEAALEDVLADPATVERGDYTDAALPEPIETVTATAGDLADADD